MEEVVFILDNGGQGRREHARFGRVCEFQAAREGRREEGDVMDGGHRHCTVVAEDILRCVAHVEQQQRVAILIL